MQHTIDAAGKSIGRVATEAASFLNGKMHPSFERNKKEAMFVEITNASKLRISEKKSTSVTYARYSGYPGGLTKTRMDAVIDKKGYEELLRIAVKGMLPANKLRPSLMKRLTITK